MYLIYITVLARLKKPSSKPETPKHQESEDQVDTENEPNQEEDETKPQNSFGQTALKFLSSVFQG